MKFIFTTVFALLLCVQVHAQDDSRWGAGIGYQTGLTSLSSSQISNDYAMWKLGVIRHIRLGEISSLFWGLEVAKLSVTIPDYSPGFLQPIVPGSEVSPTMVSLCAGVKKQQWNDLFYYTMAVVLEYDFGAPSEFGYALQNGLGFQTGLGKDIHISDNYVISIEPILRFRSIVSFRKGELSAIGEANSQLLLDGGINVNFAYKFF